VTVVSFVPPPKGLCFHRL